MSKRAMKWANELWNEPMSREMMSELSKWATKRANEQRNDPMNGEMSSESSISAGKQASERVNEQDWVKLRDCNEMRKTALNAKRNA